MQRPLLAIAGPAEDEGGSEAVAVVERDGPVRTAHRQCHRRTELHANDVAFAPDGRVEGVIDALALSPKHNVLPAGGARGHWGCRGRAHEVAWPA